MKNFNIESPCTENWNEMSPTDKGAVCQKCALEVYDFTGKSSDEIKAVLVQNIGRRVCGKYEEEQIVQLNREYDAWKFNSQRSMQRAMFFSLVVVFGLTLFSCNDQKDATAIERVHVGMNKIIDEANSNEQLSMNKDVKFATIQKETKVDVMATPLIEEVEKVQLVNEGLEAVLVKQERNQDLYRTITTTMGVSMSTHYFNEYLREAVVEHSVPVSEIELDENGLEFPEVFGTLAYPNPTSDISTLKVELPSDQEVVMINLFSMSGSLINKVFEAKLPRGTHEFNLNLVDLEPGIYLATVISNDFKETVRISKN